VRRGEGLTLVAGYPWFGDWGRDTFIALRGLCLATGHYRTAAAILAEWAEHVSERMLPNRFPDAAYGSPEYNSVDASLWFVLAADELLEHPRARRAVSSARRRALEAAICRIVVGYARGTRFGIHTDEDGLDRRARDVATEPLEPLPVAPIDPLLGVDVDAPVLGDRVVGVGLGSLRGRLRAEHEPQERQPGSLAGHADALGGGRIAGGEPRLVEQELGWWLVPLALEAPAALSEQLVDALSGAPGHVEHLGASRRVELLEHELAALGVAHVDAVETEHV
jgi:hypothetical protein